MELIQWDLIRAVSIIGLCLITMPFVIRRLIAPKPEPVAVKQSQNTNRSDS